MTESTIRANLKTILQGVTSIGTVHDYERWSSTWDVFLSLFKTTISGSDVIRGWTIAMNGAELTPLDTEPGAAMFGVTYSYTIRGYFGVNDAAATEKTALALALDVIGALIAGADTLGAAVLNAPLPQLNTFEYRLIGGVLVHYIEISQPVETILKVSEL